MKLGGNWAEHGLNRNAGRKPGCGGRPHGFSPGTCPRLPVPGIRLKPRQRASMRRETDWRGCEFRRSAPVGSAPSVADARKGTGGSVVASDGKVQPAEEPAQVPFREME